LDTHQAIYAGKSLDNNTVGKFKLSTLKYLRFFRSSHSFYLESKLDIQTMKFNDFTSGEVSRALTIAKEFASRFKRKGFLMVV